MLPPNLGVVGNKPVPAPGTVPDNLAYDSYITELYYDVLSRVPVSQEVSGWAIAYNAAGQNNLVVANGIVNSSESLARIIGEDYSRLLGRAPELGAVPNWLHALNTGLNTQQLLVVIASSEEYYARQGGTNTAWLTGLYQDLLGRQPDPVGRAAWSSALQQGLSRAAVATGFVYSGEENALQVDQAYRDLLGRPADPSGLQAWSAALAQGMTWQQLRVMFAASPEEYTTAQGENLATSDQFRRIAQWNAEPLQLPPDPPAIVVGPSIDVNKEKGDQSETTIAINPTNPKEMFLAANENDTNFGVMGAYTTDGGLTWHPRVLGNGSDGLPPMFGDPWVAFDKFGNLFFADLGGSDQGHLQIFLSTDGGKTFNTNLLFSKSILDHPEITTGDGVVWCAYGVGTFSGGFHMEVAGASVTGLGQVGAFKTFTVPNSDGENLSEIAVGPTGQVAVTFQSNVGLSPGPDKAMVSTNLGGLNGTFATPVVASNLQVGDARPIPASSFRDTSATLSLAYDRSNGPHKGRLYLTYTDAADTTTNDTNIFERHSDDDGATWSAPVRVNDDKTTNSQFFGHLAVDQTNGNVGVAWYDARNDPQNTAVQVFGTISTDGGASFAPNVQISAGSSNAVKAGDNNGIDFGDYLGLAYFNGIFVPAWADNSPGLVGNPDGTSAFDIAIAVGQTAGGTIGIGGGGGGGGSGGLGADRFEPNDTSDQATLFGVLLGSQTFNNLTIATHPNGLQDYDWYRWSAGQSGTFTATIKYTTLDGGDLHIRLFTLNSSGDLVQLASSRLQHVTTQTVSVPVAPGEPLLLWVYGFDRAQGAYSLTDNLA
jgi:hypothetical protein